MAFEKVQPDNLLVGDRVLTRDEDDRGEPVEVMARPELNANRDGSYYWTVATSGGLRTFAHAEDVFRLTT